MASPASPGARRFAFVVNGSAGPEDLLNAVLEPRGFAPVVMVSSVAELITRIRVGAPTLVVVPVPAGGTSADFSLLAMELRRHPTMAAIGTAASKDADTVLGAMRAGIPEFISSTAGAEELSAAVSRVLANFSLPGQAGQVYTVYAAKGGVGTSMIAASVSWALAQLDATRESALVDFNTAGAGMRVMLNLSPSYDMGSVAMRADRLDREYLRSVVTQPVDRVSVLTAAEELDAVESLDAEASGVLIELLRQDYAYTVIDTDHHFNGQTLAALDAADRILLVTQFDVSALRSTQRSLGVFARLGYPAEKVMIVTNRRTDRDRISVQGAERVLGRSISFLLPNDYNACSGAITQGQFVQRYATASPLVSAFAGMAAKLAGQPVSANGNGNGNGNGKHSVPSRLSRLFSRKSS
jgi:pilus assembly protein CpaE